MIEHLPCSVARPQSQHHRDQSPGRLHGLASHKRSFMRRPALWPSPTCCRQHVGDKMALQEKPYGRRTRSLPGERAGAVLSQEGHLSSVAVSRKRRLPILSVTVTMRRALAVAIATSRSSPKPRRNSNGPSRRWTSRVLAPTATGGRTRGHSPHSGCRCPPHAN